MIHPGVREEPESAAQFRPEPLPGKSEREPFITATLLQQQWGLTRATPYLSNARQVPMPKLPPEERIKTFDEVELGYTEELARLEGNRCFGCDSQVCIGCGVCVNVCPVGIIFLNADLNKEGNYHPRQYYINEELCCFCGLCVEECPTGSLYMTNDYEVASQGRGEFLYDKKKLLPPGKS